MKLKFFAVFVSIFFVFLWAVVAHAASISATQVIGQLNPLNNPSFIQGTVNSPQVNSHGFNTPSYVVADETNHRLFVSDSGNNRILVFNLNSSNQLVDYVADNVLGQVNFTSSSADQGGFVSASTLDQPLGLSFDSVNNLLFVADFDNSRVLVFDVASITDGEAAVSVLGQADFITVATSISSSKLRNPSSVFLNAPSNTLYVADTTNNRVLVFDVASITDGEAAVSVLGQANFTSVSVNRGGSASNSSLSNPRGLAFNSQSSTLYVSDRSNNRVLVFDVASITDGEAAVAVLGQADFTSVSINQGGSRSNSSLNNPRDLQFVSTTNRLFVSDYDNSRVLIFDVASTTNGEAAVSVLGQADFTSLSTSASSSVVAKPLNSYMLASNNILYVSDSSNNRVLVFDATSITNGEAAASVLGQLDGNNSQNFTQRAVNSAVVNNYSFSTPKDMVFDETNHRLFVSDSGNNRILVFNLNSSNQLVDYVADNVLGQVNFTSSSADQGGSVSASTLDQPSGLSFDSVNNLLFVADYNNNRVLVFDATSITNGEAAVSVLGQADFTSAFANQGGSASNVTLYQPIEILFNHQSSTLYVSDSSNNRVLVFDVASITDGEAAVSVLGQADFTSVSANQGGSASNATLYQPVGIDLDKVNNSSLYVSDSSNNRVLVFDVASITDGEAAVSVLGQADFTSVSANQGVSPSDNGGLSAPLFVSFVTSSNNKYLFVGDSQNNRLAVFDVTSISNGEGMNMVFGQEDFASTNANQGSTVSAVSLSSPSGVTVISDNLVHIADSGNNRLLKYALVNLPASSLVDGTVNSTYSQSVSATNTQGGISYVVSSGSLPTGLSIDSSGVISGTPSTAGTFSFTIYAQDEFADTSRFRDYQNYSILINGSSAGSGGSGGGGSPVPVSSASQGGILVASSSVFSPAPIAVPSVDVPVVDPSFSGSNNKPTSIKFIFTKNLKLGSTGEEVKKLQEKLREIGLFNFSSNTGYYGQVTKRAVVSFQKKYGLKPFPGTVGPLTRKTLNSI